MLEEVDSSLPAGQAVDLPAGAIGTPAYALGLVMTAEGAQRWVPLAAKDPAATPRGRTRGSPEEEDIRIMPVRFDPQGERFRPFPEAVAMM